MEISVGTTNAAKLDAVREILADYPHLSQAEVASVGSDQSPWPDAKSRDRRGGRRDRHPHEGRINRKEYTEQALRMALIHLEENE